MYVNSRSNSFVQDGVLHIRPTLTEDKYGSEFLYNGVLDLRGSSRPGEGCTNSYNNGCYKRAIGANILNPVMSAQLQTGETFAFQYGIIKIRAKMPRGDWLLPGVYLLPRHNAYGANLLSGKVMVAESRGNEALSIDGVSYGVRRVEMGLQYGPSRKNESIMKIFTSSEENTWASSFHDYEVEWTPDYIQFKVDSKEAVKVSTPSNGGFHSADDNIINSGSKLSPFDKPFFIALSLAVGGTSGIFPDKVDNKPHPKPWNNTSPSAVLDFWEKKNDWYSTWQKGEADLQIDSIRVWALP